MAPAPVPPCRTSVNTYGHLFSPIPMNVVQLLHGMDKCCWLVAWTHWTSLAFGKTKTRFNYSNWNRNAWMNKPARKSHWRYSTCAPSLFGPRTWTWEMNGLSKVMARLHRAESRHRCTCLLIKAGCEIELPQILILFATSYSLTLFFIV